MKKHLIAAAVAGALAVPAMAQVSISGYLETGVSSVDADSTATGAAATKTVKRTKVGGSPVGTTGIKFSGTEDLGGGLKASFTLAKDIETETGAEVDDTFQNAFIGLSGGFGSVTLGRQNDGAQEAGALYRFFGDLGRTSMRDGSYETNAIQYVTPSVSGFTLGVFHQATGKKADETNDKKITSFIVKGAVGGLNVAIAQQTYNTTGADGNDDVRQGISANYDFGMAKVGAAYMTFKDDSSASDEKTKFRAIHAMMPVSGALSVGIAYNTYEDDADKLTQTVLQAKYALSKRTAINFAYETNKTEGSVPNHGASTEPTASNGVGACYLANATCNGMVMSVSHSF